MKLKFRQLKNTGVSLIIYLVHACKFKNFFCIFLIYQKPGTLNERYFGSLDCTRVQNFMPFFSIFSRGACPT